MLPWSCNYYQGGYKREYPYYPYDYSGKIIFSNTDCSPLWKYCSGVLLQEGVPLYYPFNYSGKIIDRIDNCSPIQKCCP
jgi:hypothetical protein